MSKETKDLFFKAHVRQHQRRLRSGKVVDVVAHDDNRPSAAGNRKKQALFDRHIEMMKDAYRAGATLKEIAHQVGINELTARAWLIDAGVFEHKRGRVSREQEQSILTSYLAGDALNEIASRHGVERTTVSRIAERNGVLRSKSESQSVRAARDGVGIDQFGKKGAFHSSKMNSWVPTDSLYEYARMEQLDGDESVISWRRSVARIPYEFNGVGRIYVPDIEVTLVGGRLRIEEIKPKKFTSSPLNVAKFAAGEKFALENGYEFKVVTEDDIGRAAIEKAGLATVTGIPEHERKRRRVEATQRAIAKMTAEQKAEYLRKARDREKAKRDAMTTEQRAGYNAKARERKAAKMAKSMIVFINSVAIPSAVQGGLF